MVICFGIFTIYDLSLTTVARGTGHWQGLPDPAVTMCALLQGQELTVEARLQHPSHSLLLLHGGIRHGRETIRSRHLGHSATYQSLLTSCSAQITYKPVQYVGFGAATFGLRCDGLAFAALGDS